MENFNDFDFFRKTKINKKKCKKLLLIKAPFRVEERLHKTSENDPWCVFYGSTSFHRLFLAFHSEKIEKIAFFNNKIKRNRFDKMKKIISVFSKVSFLRNHDNSPA